MPRIAGKLVRGGLVKKDVRKDMAAAPPLTTGFFEDDDIVKYGCGSGCGCDSHRAEDFEPGEIYVRMNKLNWTKAALVANRLRSWHFAELRLGLYGEGGVRDAQEVADIVRQFHSMPLHLVLEDELRYTGEMFRSILASPGLRCITIYNNSSDEFGFDPEAISELMFAPSGGPVEIDMDRIDRRDLWVVLEGLPRIARKRVSFGLGSLTDEEKTRMLGMLGAIGAAGALLTQHPARLMYPSRSRIVIETREHEHEHEHEHEPTLAVDYYL